jgi:hypothetical protein
MKRDTQARVLAVVALLAALGVGVARQAGWFDLAAAPATTTEDAISAGVYATMNAARAGDVNRYLDGYTGPMRSALQRSLDDSGAPAFARYLQSLDAEVKGLAVSVESSGQREARARVEYVYQERNSVQAVYLEKERGVWRIARTEDNQTVKAAIPYGTPIR